MVKVSTKQKSSLSNRKVNTKSDAFLIESEIPYSTHLENQFILAEDDISKFEYKKVAKPGISVKRPDSKSYTLQKFTRDSFYKAFENYMSIVCENVMCKCLFLFSENVIIEIKIN
ncbi:hypothetical protein H1057_05585 [Clostridium sporogenes]|uniref:hypothetical protein n=1 Tax=Clostridium sporogenes TaxID=1509 RepID=UPI0015EF0A1E|nr:hypothetical protein [Clostridium sporogenes]MBA4507524.1 hypothetical protein [Clostridium sporogenes]MDD3995869.1 hypothetical protein [Bacilli bacterium]